MIGRFLRDQSGSPAVEFALTLPMMLALMFGGLEAGHFFWTEHKLVKAVEGDIQAVTATGLPAAASAAPKVPGWNPDDVDVNVACQDFVGTGIYSELGSAGAIVTVSSGPVAYPSLFEALGAITSTVQISAESSAPVTGL